MDELHDATILVLAPHTDDGELGAGASIAKWAEAGNDVNYLAFSACETIQPADRPSDVLRGECAAATSELGIPRSNLEILDFEVRNFARDRQDVLDTMVRVNRQMRPDVVLVPSIADTHQDHAVVATEARRAFKTTRMLGYEVPWNNFQFDTTAFVVTDEAHVATKCRSLAHFRSQEGRPYMTEEYLWSQSRFRGVQAGSSYAEAFQIIRWFL